MNPDDAAAWLDRLPCAALLLDRWGVIVHANPPLAELLRAPARDCVGKRAASLFRSTDDEPLRFESLLDAEIQLDPATDKPLTLLARACALSTMTLLTLVDVTRLKRAEAEMTERYGTISQLSDTILAQALDLKHYSETLEARVAERTAELFDANIDAIFMLAVASEAKDFDTGAHVRRIQYYAERLAQRIGIAREEAQRIGYSSILHDVGKIHVPDEILHNPGQLNESEWRIIREHTVVGERILADKPFFHLARQIARSHHENWDGSGYPDALAGEAIPLAARIVRLVDVFDALTSARPYKQVWSNDEAARFIISGSGTSFDPRMVAAFQAEAAAGEFCSKKAQDFASRNWIPAITAAAPRGETP